MVNLAEIVYSIKLLGGVLNSEKPEPPSKKTDWNFFIKFCERHCISNIVAYALNQFNSDVPQDVKNYFDDVIYQSLAKEARLEVEVSELIDCFEKNGIEHMLLKGFVIKNFYPQPDMRSMCDVDILVGTKLDSAMQVLFQHGYKLKERDNLHDCYFKKPFINIELHSSLMDEELADLYKYFRTGFEKAEKLSGFNFRYILQKEDFYIYMLAHLAKHFRRTGSGVRSVADVYVFLLSNPDLDFDYIDSEFEKLGLLMFSRRIRSVAFKWFSRGVVDYNDPVEEYILSSGTYGSLLNLELNRFLQDNDDNGNFRFKKFLYFKSVVFPDYEYMVARYPQLKTKKFLLPFFWIKRIVYTIFKRKENIRYRLKGVSESKESQREKFSDFN